MRALLIAALCSALPLSVQAQSYVAFNRLVVVPLNATDFEVIESRGEGPRGIWCAAASFAQHRLGTPRNARIYVKTARGPSRSGAGAKGVVFTTSTQGITPKTAYSISVRQPGLGLPQYHALQFCKDYLIEPEDRL
jgi:hypothetical protein